MLENIEGAIKNERILKGQSKKDNPEKLTTQGAQDEEKQNNMCRTPLCANKHKSHGVQNVKTHNRPKQMKTLWNIHY